MAMRAPMIYAGLFLLGIVLLAAGAFIQPYRTATAAGSEVGESLVALGLTFIVVGLGFFLAWANPTQ